jgi:putative tricarboxylic transport membrane protein
LPGVGAAIVSFLSYSEAKRWSKNPENFGKEEPNGVVASETANNAATGGAMIPLLALGLPGGAFTAIMAGVFTIHTLETGPLIMVRAHDMVWVLFAAMFLASVVISFVSFIEARCVVNMLKIPFSLLAPIIVVFTMLDAYALRNNILDV